MDKTNEDRRAFIGGSDTRIVTGRNEVVLVRLWRENGGEIESADLSGELIVQSGLLTEELSRPWFERNIGHRVGLVQKRVAPQCWSCVS